MADMLTAHPQLGSTFSVTDIYALGSAQELQAAHKLNVEQVSIDATAQGVQLILNHGGINAEVAQHLKKVGYTAVVTLGKALNGQPVPADIDTGTTLVTAANAKVYLKQVLADSK
jgi:ABC-type sugar transport system substrate-binding protein